MKFELRKNEKYYFLIYNSTMQLTTITFYNMQLHFIVIYIRGFS